MLNPPPDPAQGLLADAKIGGNMPQRHPFNDMRRSLKQVVIPFGSRFEMCVYKALLQPYIIFFICNSDKPFYFMIIVKKTGQFFFRDHPE